MKKTKTLLKIFCSIAVFGFVFNGNIHNREYPFNLLQNNPILNNKIENIMNDKKSDADYNPIDSLSDIINSEPEIVIMETSLGNITIELYPKDAPLHAANFKKLVYNHFYDGLLFHRVIKDFMIQSGDPNTRDGDESTWGQGGPGYTITAEINLKHVKGSLAAARMGDQVNPKKESSGSQFYIVTGDASFLDGQYTVFGKVTEGLDVADKIQKVRTSGQPFDRPLDKVVINKVYFAE